MFLAFSVLSNENSYLFHVKRSLEFESLGLSEQCSDVIKVLDSFYTFALPLSLFIEHLFILEIFMEYLLYARKSSSYFLIFQLSFHLDMYCLMIVRQFFPLQTSQSHLKIESWEVQWQKIFSSGTSILLSGEENFLRSIQKII